MDKKNKIEFISTSIPYVNANPHLGHAMEFVMTDIIARYKRLTNTDIFFVSGTDDNALKNVQSAEKEGIPVAEFVKKHAERFKELATILAVSNDYFIETSVDKQHKLGAQKLWEQAQKDIYKKKYKGLYCVGCEEFKTEKDLINGKCSEHPDSIPEVVEEENYFFRLSAYQKQLHDLISTDKIEIIPQSRRNETLRFIEMGLEDFSISRSVERAHWWGIPVPKDDSQIQYVWFDALSNYINALGYASDSDKFKKYWTEVSEATHVIGKGILRFHAIYWPAILLSAGIRLPTKIIVHGYITINGAKMSKSVGNVISPKDVVDEYGTDALRYYLARHINPFEDSDFTKEKFKEAYNANLANGIGNLTARIMKLAETYLDKSVVKNLGRRTVLKEELYDGERTVLGERFEELNNAFEKFEINKAVDLIWEHIGDLDKYIQTEKPFSVVKEDKEKGIKIIQNITIKLYSIADMLKPFMPETSEKIKNAVKQNKMPEPLFARK